MAHLLAFKFDLSDFGLFLGLYFGTFVIAVALGFKIVLFVDW